MILFRAYFIAISLALLRTPAYWVSTLLFPVMLFAFFGLAPANNYPTQANLVVASWCCFAVLGVCYYQFGVGIAIDRASVWEQYLRTLPTGPVPRFAAQVVVAIGFAAAATLLVAVLALLATPMSLSPTAAAAMAAALLLGAVPFTLLGITIGYVTSAKAAVPVANLLHLPLAFAGGLWIPPDRLPAVVQSISAFLPTRHYGELAWASAMQGAWPLTSVAWLLGYTLLFGALAVAAHRRDQGQRYA